MFHLDAYLIRAYFKSDEMAKMLNQINCSHQKPPTNCHEKHCIFHFVCKKILWENLKAIGRNTSYFTAISRNYSENNPVKIIFAFQQNTILKHKYQRHILFKRYSHIILMEEEMGKRFSIAIQLTGI